MSGLARQHHDLPTVMRFMRDQICENVDHINGQIHPCHSRYRNSSAAIDSELEQFDDPATAPRERWQQLLARHRVQTDSLWSQDPESLAQHLDPHAANIVNVRSDRAHGTSRGGSHRQGPQYGRKILEQEGRYPVVGLPGRDNGIGKIEP